MSTCQSSPSFHPISACMHGVHPAINEQTESPLLLLAVGHASLSSLECSTLRRSRRRGSTVPSLSEFTHKANYRS